MSHDHLTPIIKIAAFIHRLTLKLTLKLTLQFCRQNLSWRSVRPTAVKKYVHENWTLFHRPHKTQSGQVWISISSALNYKTFSLKKCILWDFFFLQNIKCEINIFFYYYYNFYLLKQNFIWNLKNLDEYILLHIYFFNGYHWHYGV